jgi:hypothetical protein
MSLEDTSLTLLRHLIDDVNSTYEYTDERLTELLYVSATYVNLELNTAYSINLCAQTISPDPDNVFYNLVALKAACLLVRSTQTSYAKSDFKVTDGPTSVDLKGTADKLKVSADGFCNQYERTKMAFLMGDTNYGGGYAVSTPSSAC